MSFKEILQMIPDCSRKRICFDILWESEKEDELYQAALEVLKGEKKDGLL